MSWTRTSFPPISTPEATVLILGSMPGERSLREQQYYAHPQNGFWKIMEQLTGLEWSSSYDDRVLRMKEVGIAIWDVIRCCERPGSLDGSIRKDSIEPNDFASFFRDHARIELICFNGATAAEAFRRYVVPTLVSREWKCLRMPSTSPAHTMSFDKKFAAWSGIMAHLRGRAPNSASSQ